MFKISLIKPIMLSSKTKCISFSKDIIVQIFGFSNLKLSEGVIESICLILLMKTSTVLRNVTYLSKNAEKSAQFFIDVLGLKINQFSESYSELVDSNNFKLVFKKCGSEAHVRTAFNPLLTFNVADYDDVRKKLDNYESIEIESEVKESELGKYASVRTAEGIMLIIYEAKSPEIDEEDYNVDINEESKLDPNTAEIRNILEKIKL